MNKLIAAICILISSVLAFALIAILIAGITGHSIFNWRVNDLEFYISGGDSVMLKEESVGLSDCKSLKLDVPSNEVYVRAVSGDKLTVRQYGPSNVNSSDIFYINKSGDSVSIRKDSRIRIGFFFWTREYIEIEVPESWHGNVDFKTSSGGINIEDSFEWDGIALKCSSGGINVERELKGGAVDISASSGGISIQSLVKADILNIKVSSGGIKTERLEANSISIESSSGGISLRDTVKTGDLYMRCTSGGMKAELLETETFSIETSSGGVKLTELSGQGSIKCTSGGVKIDMLNPTGNVDIKASSGGIVVDVPNNLSNLVHTSATSGTVVVNER